MIVTCLFLQTRQGCLLLPFYLLLKGCLGDITNKQRFTITHTQAPYSASVNVTITLIFRGHIPCSTHGNGGLWVKLSVSYYHQNISFYYHWQRDCKQDYEIVKSVL